MPFFPKKVHVKILGGGGQPLTKLLEGEGDALNPPLPPPPNIFMVSFHSKISNSEMFLNPLSLMRVSFDSEDHTLINSLLKAYQSVARWRSKGGVKKSNFKSSKPEIETGVRNRSSKQEFKSGDRNYCLLKLFRRLKRHQGLRGAGGGKVRLGISLCQVRLSKKTPEIMTP